jgi:S1-C subfamily serine protease
VGDAALGGARLAYRRRKVWGVAASFRVGRPDCLSLLPRQYPSARPGTRKVVATSTVIGADKVRDLALVRASTPIAGYRFRIGERGSAAREEVGALGFPLGLPLTVTKGSVSGLDRTIAIEGVKRRGLVQTDAALNPGNSGGPLISLATGKVVGLVDAGSQQAHGIAFAVDSRTAAALVDAWKTAPQPVAARSCSGAAGPPVTPSAPPTSVPDADRAYADAIDGALIDSARTRRGLGELITLVNPSAISYQQASSAIAANETGQHCRQRSRV